MKNPYTPVRAALGVPFRAWFEPYPHALCLLAVALWTLLPASSEAASFSFTKIVETGAPVPGKPAQFTGLGIPSVDGRTVAFLGFDSGSQRGVYTGDGGPVTTIADTQTTLPGGGGTFSTFNYVSIGSGAVAFLATGTSFDQQGAYLSEGGSLRTVADTATPVPGGTETFSSFDYVSVEGGQVAFTATGTGINQRGVYLRSGDALTTIADTSTPIPPGAGNFSDFGYSAVDGGTVSFIGYGANPRQGVYAGDGGTLTTVADTNTIIPGTEKNFFRFGYIVGSDFAAIDNGTVAFLGTNEKVSKYGVYTGSGGPLETVADKHTPVPGAGRRFRGFGYAALDDGNLAFLGFRSASREGIYWSTPDRPLARVIEVGALLDGRQVTTLRLGPESVSGNSIAFYVEFSDLSSGIYRADLDPDTEPLSTPP